MKIKALVLASALLLCASAFAQESNRDANGKIQFGPYETNKFWDNWFITIGGGANMAQDGVIDAIKGNKDAFKYGLGLAIDANVGKWIDPCFGVRIGWTGLNTGDCTIPSKTQFPGPVGYNFIHADLLWNWSHQFAGYKETRTINVVPYLAAGALVGTKTDVKSSFALAPGFMFPIRCGGVVSIVPDIRYVICPQGGVFNGIGYSANLTATIGVQFNLGKNNWTRKSTSMAAAAAALAAAEAARNALQADNDKLAAERAAEAARAAKLAQENSDLKDQIANHKCGVDLADAPVCAYFDLGKATLSCKELAHLEYNVKTILASDKNVNFIVTGSADKFGGSAKRNAKLAQLRADYLAKVLVEKFGLNADNFTIATQVVEGKAPLSRAVIISK